ncbi:MAG: PhoH family protein [Bacteroidales bacterium]|nr:PhoH family protein [Bacteroidales bacterium]
MRKISLKVDIDNPAGFFGPKHVNFYSLQSYFKDIEIIARGNKLIMKGEKKHLDDAVNKIKSLIEIYKTKKYLTSEIIENFMVNLNNNKVDINNTEEVIIIHNKDGKPIKTYTPNQKKIVDFVEKYDLIFITGPAGTGKTYTAIALAVRALKTKQIKRIILSRPAVEAGESLGYLPGNIKEKLDPYLQPLYDAILDMIPAYKLEEYIRDKVIEIAPLAYMRGRTLDNAFVILDEAQNSTIMQLKMFLTRMGKNAKFIITGDITQVDLVDPKKSGMILALKILKNIKEIGFVNLDETDIIRHKLVKEIVKSFNNWNKKIK